MFDCNDRRIRSPERNTVCGSTSSSGPSPLARRIRYCSPGCATVSAPPPGAKNSAFAVGRGDGVDMVGRGPDVGRDPFADGTSPGAGDRGPTCGGGATGAGGPSACTAGGGTASPGSVGESDDEGSIRAVAGSVAPDGFTNATEPSDESLKAARPMRAATRTTMPIAAAALSRPKRCHI